MPSERVLVCGAGVAGSVAAFWLAKNDFQVVVIERSKTGQKQGQGIEIEEPAWQVVEAMGILPKLKEMKTSETGFSLVNAQGRSLGIMKASEKPGEISFTGALELMRGDLTEVLYKAADESANVTYRFETTLHRIRQTQDKAIVDLENRNDKTITTEEFDLVIGADGVGSRTRQLTMGSPEQLDCYKRIGAFVAYFSIPKEPQDSPYSRACQFPGRRIIWTRPVREESDVTSVYTIHCADDAPKFRQAKASGDRLKQKQAVAEMYSGLGWETPRVMEQMMHAENFYADELVQVKLQKWSQGRVALVGDAAWAPTPFTGQGNQLAIIGGWVLAQELSRNRSTVAFEIYEKRLRSYVESSQNIPLGGYAPYIFTPRTSFGIWLFRTTFSIFAWLLNSALWTKLTRMWPAQQQQQPEFDFDLQMKKPSMKEQ